MVRLVFQFVVILLLLSGGSGVFAQDSGQTGDEDESSRQTEQTDESYRQQMELEDARDRDRTYIDNTHTQKGELEKIDKLPEESRDNIRDQLVDIIMENGEWEPKDALGEYPYTPTAAAEGDPKLKQQEQEAWEEQIEKYHEREAAAFGTHRGPVPGPGNPTGQEGGQQGQDSQQGQQGGQQGSGQGGQSGGEGSSGAGSAGTYEPYQSSSSSSEDEVSTAGVSESALDFLRGGKGRQQPPPQGTDAQQQAQQLQTQTQAQAEAQAQSESRLQEEQLAQQQASASEQAAPETAEAAQDEQQEQAEPTEVDNRGIIAIRDLDKLEGANGSGEEEDQDEP
jgi:hypothetical protein